jgi:serine phosphatase RsbU (regulator of sigma subunit)/anti-anti-sigma regulatory factor
MPAAMMTTRPTPAESGRSPVNSPPEDAAEGRILVVDDDPVICRLLSTLLQRGGYKFVETARDAECAQAVLRRGGFGVVITDIRMPGTDGLSLMRWALVNCPGPAWIVLSGRATFDDAVKAVKLGAFDFISKPIVETESFLVSVRNALWQRTLIAEQVRLQSELERRNAELRQRVGQLEEAFNLLTEQSEIISQDLVRAELVQRALLPQRVPELGAFTFDAYYRPSHKVGGDIYDVVRIDDDHAAFYVADAAGHGVSAAMVAVLFKLRLRLYDTAAGRVLPPNQVLTEVNRAILRECSAPGLFITAALCQLNIKTGELLVASGGHPPLLLRRATGPIETIVKTGPALGLDEDATFTLWSTRLNPGDRLLLYTDGITDPGAAGKAPDYHAMLALLSGAPGDPQQLLLRIREQAFGRNGNEEREDDITLVLVTAGATGGTLNHESASASPAPAVSTHSGGIFAGSTSQATFYRFRGRCGWSQAAAFHDACSDDIAAGKRITLDFDGCVFLDSTMLGTIHEAHAHAKKSGTPFTLQALPREIHGMFEELAMDSVVQSVVDPPQPAPLEMIPLALLPTPSNRVRRRITEAHEAIVAISDRNREKFMDVLVELQRGAGPDQDPSAPPTTGSAQFSD